MEQGQEQSTDGLNKTPCPGAAVLGLEITLAVTMMLKAQWPIPAAGAASQSSVLGRAKRIGTVWPGED